MLVGKALRKIEKKDSKDVVIVNDDEDEIDRAIDNPFDEFSKTSEPHNEFDESKQEKGGMTGSEGTIENEEPKTENQDDENGKNGRE